MLFRSTSTPEKAELARQHGADEVVLYRQENTVERVLAWTNGEGVDAIFDGVGKDTCVHFSLTGPSYLVILRIAHE